MDILVQNVGPYAQVYASSLCNIVASQVLFPRREVLNTGIGSRVLLGSQT